MKTYLLLDGHRQPYRTVRPGALGGNRASRIYGRLDCPAALRALNNGGYLTNRVFFANEPTAAAAGFRPCGTCLLQQYRAWKAGARRGAGR